VIAEYDEDGQLIDNYVYLGQMRLAKFNRDRKRYYINDIRGSVAMIMDTAGTTIAEMEYYPFGSVLSQTGESHLKYTGKELDQGYDFDLYYYGARYYNAEWGRFISPDPVREYYNLYSYVLNNPVNRIDPFGLWYIDFNGSIGAFGHGATGGIMIGDAGIYYYGGGGLVSSPGLGITYSPSDPSSGGTVGLQGGFIVGGQVGAGSAGIFGEVGLVIPLGASLTVYTVKRIPTEQILKDITGLTRAERQMKATKELLAANAKHSVSAQGYGDPYRAGPGGFTDASDTVPDNRVGEVTVDPTNYYVDPRTGKLRDQYGNTYDVPPWESGDPGDE